MCIRQTLSTTKTGPKFKQRCNLKKRINIDMKIKVAGKKTLLGNCRWVWQLQNSNKKVTPTWTTVTELLKSRRSVMRKKHGIYFYRWEEQPLQRFPLKLSFLSNNLWLNMEPTSHQRSRTISFQHSYSIRSQNGSVWRSPQRSSPTFLPTLPSATSTLPLNPCRDGDSTSYCKHKVLFEEVCQ